MYLNNAYFGNGVWGIEDASKKYFGVSASELTLDQSAVLAGMDSGQLSGPGVCATSGQCFRTRLSTSAQGVPR